MLSVKWFVAANLLMVALIVRFKHEQYKEELQTQVEVGGRMVAQGELRGQHRSFAGVDSLWFGRADYKMCPGCGVDLSVYTAHKHLVRYPIEPSFLHFLKETR